ERVLAPARVHVRRRVQDARPVQGRPPAELDAVVDRGGTVVTARDEMRMHVDDPLALLHGSRMPNLCLVPQTRREFLLTAALALPTLRSLSLADPRLKSLAAAVRGPVLTRASASYDSARLIFDSLYDSARPLAIVRPLDAKDVSAAVRWAAKTGVHIVARSGGHSYGGYSTTSGGVVVDLSQLAGVHGSGTRGAVGAGARLGNIYDALGAHVRSMPAGTCPSVGIG